MENQATGALWLAARCSSDRYQGLPAHLTGLSFSMRMGTVGPARNGRLQSHGEIYDKRNVDANDSQKPAVP